MITDLSGKRALVCGASAGIGRACAFELALLGASVVAVARNAETLRSAVEHLPSREPARHEFLACDLSRHAEARRAVESLLVRAGPVHILVNNTGGPAPGAAIDTPPEAFAAGFESLLLAPHALAQACVPGMKAAGYGRIINIASTSVKSPIPNLAVSNAVRAATANWAKTLSVELAAFGITVNNVLPGYTDTERLTELFQAKAKRGGVTIDAVRADAVASIPAGRLGLPQEVAAAVAFLATPAAAYVNGINLPVDGGRLGTL